MAVVRISEELVDKVKQNARNSFAPMEVKAKAQLDTRFMDGVYDRTIGQHLPTMNQLPSWMFEKWAGIDLEQLIDSKGGTITLVVGSTEVPFSSPRLMPSINALERSRDFKLKRNGSYGSGVKYVIDTTIPFDVELLDAVKARNAAIERVKRMQEDLSGGFAKVLESFTTLAPALKACPALWDFLPEMTKQKHMEIKEKKTSTVDLSGLDSDRITSLAAISKMVK